VRAAGRRPGAPPPRSATTGYYRESTDFDLSNYRISPHMLARLRMGLQWQVPRRNILCTKQVCRLRQDLPEEFGTKRSQVQILSARFSSIHLTERHFRFSPVVGWCGLQDGKPGDSTGFQVAPGTQASFSPPTQAVLASGRHPLWQGALPRCAAPPRSQVRAIRSPAHEWAADCRMSRIQPPSGRGYALDRDAIVGGRDRACTGRRESVSVAELLVRPWNHAEVYYRKPEGLPSPQLICLRAAIGPLRHCGLRSDPGCNPFQLSPSCRGSPKRV